MIIKKKQLLIIAALLTGILSAGSIFIFKSTHNQSYVQGNKNTSALKSLSKQPEEKPVSENSTVRKEKSVSIPEQTKNRSPNETIQDRPETIKENTVSIQGKKENQNTVSGTENKELRKKVLDSIKLTVDYMNSYYSKNDYKGFLDWSSAAMYSAKADIQPKNLERALAWKEREIKEGSDFDSERSTDYHRSIIGILSAGANVRNFAGINFIAAVQKSQLADGKFADAIGGKGDRLINSHVWGIIALYSAGEKIPDSKGAYNWLASNQNPDGGFGILTGGKSDIDMTGMALSAFGALGKDGSDKNVKKAVEYIKANQSRSGGFEIFGKENPDTASAVVQGLISVGVDPLSEDWLKDGGENMIDSIISFQLTNGAFEHTRGGGGDMMSTTKALTSLADYYDAKTVYQKMKEM